MHTLKKFSSYYKYALLWGGFAPILLALFVVIGVYLLGLSGSQTEVGVKDILITLGDILLIYFVALPISLLVFGFPMAYFINRKEKSSKIKFIISNLITLTIFLFIMSMFGTIVIFYNI